MPWDAYVRSGHLGEAEIWRGSHYGGDNSCDWTVLPRRLLSRYQDDTLRESWHHDPNLEYLVDRPFPDYYLAPERAWPAGTSILDDARPETRGACLSNDGYWFSSAELDDYGVSREMKYAIQRSAKNAGFLLGYGFVAYVDRKDRELHERIWYDAEGNERHDPKPKKQKRTARLSTGGKAPRKLLATRAAAAAGSRST